MTELLSTIGSLIASLGNVQSVGALKEHLALLNTKLQLVKEHAEKLEKENADLVQRNAELCQQIARQQSSAEFVEARGALFKRAAGGSYSETPYCPACGKSMWCFHDEFSYECSNDACGHKADFKGGELKQVIASLPKS